jgi:hypothetical protein
LTKSHEKGQIADLAFGFEDQRHHWAPSFSQSPKPICSFQFSVFSSQCQTAIFTPLSVLLELKPDY